MSFSEINIYGESITGTNNVFNGRPEFRIPQKQKISYKNDEEYRETICKLLSNNSYLIHYIQNLRNYSERSVDENEFCGNEVKEKNIFSVDCEEKCSLGENTFSPQSIENTDLLEGIVDESLNLYFDEDLIMKNMDLLFIHTKDNIFFQKLYDLAAVKMFSTDRTIGQCILFSYDYLVYFYECLYVFISSPEEFTENCIVYKNMIKQMS